MVMMRLTSHLLCATLVTVAIESDYRGADGEAIYVDARSRLYQTAAAAPQVLASALQRGQGDPHGEVWVLGHPGEQRPPHRPKGA